LQLQLVFDRENLNPGIVRDTDLTVLPNGLLDPIAFDSLALKLDLDP